MSDHAALSSIVCPLLSGDGVKWWRGGTHPRLGTLRLLQVKNQINPPYSQVGTLILHRFVEGFFYIDGFASVGKLLFLK